ncbi:hypothetical protein P9G84_14990 [Brevibacillus centrosporus]|uniref:pPIWI_RE_Z domain-containing protein n=1 Tax=Brevibacillus centrosporus TaxID=54910 RepID=UPI000F0A1197|nr:hypothetical protein [Brevibacillus centrosporus]MEC2130253.1 hypothetical protein [Brevibacillus centrosporus]RNB70969.1 hypothetical protein EDM55_09295 [Brevibacillus centrosporus]GED30283.1 hypothetical protein BCE02nite_14240 [Brevibacillus centrosporus]
MRKTFWDLTEEISKEFFSLELPKSEISTIISMEIFITGCLLIDPLLDIDQAWSVLVGYDEPILNNIERMDIVARLRILFPELRSKKILVRRVESYRTIDKKYRLFDINEERKTNKLVPLFLSNRHTVYEQILNKPIPRQINDMPFAIQGKFEYSRIVRGGIAQNFSGSIPEALIENEKRLLPSNREKKKLSLELPFNGLSLAREMDGIVGKSMAWENRARSVVLESLDRVKEFIYKGNQHVGGALGAGKSTFMLMETYRLVKQEGARIGFIEGSVSQVIERVRVLRELGINAAPIIGKSSRKLHQENFLFANSSEIFEISDWSKDEFQDLKHLSDVCVIKALSENYERNSHYPCTRLKQDNKSVKCPLANHCGVYCDLSRLAEADVWVATSASVLQTRIPAMIDPLERTIYEAMYDLMDIVFIDEADEVQKQFDETFLSEYNIFGNVEDIFERLFNESNQLTNGQYQFAGDPVVNEWKDKLRQLDHMIWRIYNKLDYSHTLRKNISRNLIRVAALADSLSDKISDNAEEQKKIRKCLMNYASEPFQDPTLSNIVDKLIETENIEEKQKLLTKITGKLLKGTIQPRVNRELFYAQLEFFIYLCRAEECIKFILTSFTMIQAKLGMSVDFSPLFTMQRDYQPFMKEAMTGTMIGYKYDLKDGDSTGAFKLVEYTGVGRLLLHDWHRVYEDSDQKQGPAVIFLSGTSHAPDSAHYHLNIRSKWILKAERLPSEISMTFKPLLNVRQDGFLEVSGIRDEETRNSNLYEMVQQLKSDFQYELNHWKSRGTARRILLVVNSYDDVATVGRVFRGDHSWEGRYKILSREKSHESDQFPRSMIESFRKEKAEVLVVPLMSVGRGYNILDQQGEALFGSVFFLVRPYPMPNDMKYMVQILHAYLPSYLKRIEGQSMYYEKAVSKLRQISSAKFETMYKKPDFWSILSDSEREVMAWFTFIPIWQMIGRLLRGGKNARVFYCDSKFDAKPAGKPEGMSMLDSWSSIMQKHKSDPLFESLYGPFIQGINKMIREVHCNEDDGAVYAGN